MAIQFIGEGPSSERSSVRVRIPAGIVEKQALFAVLDRTLKLPDYFGNNWDALEEVIRDLDWLDAREVVLVHEDVPMIGTSNEASVYLSILLDAVAYWESRDEHDLVVVFPPGLEEAVGQLLMSG